MEGGQVGEKRKECTLRRGTEIGNPIVIRGGNAQKTHFEMVGRLAHKFTSILNDLNVTFK